ncbi:MAG: outer membrane beta-barrel protein [Phaeodactylibacter sp.]|nr:outer membrane beta-barrel protein [Phaeodactylibacter sp.]MCB9288780.1 outer membrane beta-barrel protein [Lewinellaceae bacterium]
MRRSILPITVVAFFLLSNLRAIGQGTELGIMGGTSLYSGDLSPKEFGLYFEDVSPAFGVFGRFNVNSTFALRLGVSIGKVSANDNNHDRQDRGLNFRSNITEFALTGELNIFKLGSYQDRGVMPYVFGGVAVFNFSPEASFDGDYIELQPLGTEGQGLPGYEAPYKLTEFAIPVGLGVKFLLNDVITLGVEFGGRKLFTDYLDDVSDAQVNYFDVLEGNGELAAQLSNPTLKDPSPDTADYRRGGKYNDWYYIGGVTLSFRLQGSGGGFGKGKGIGCPTF